MGVNTLPHSCSILQFDGLGMVCGEEFCWMRNECDVVGLNECDWVGWNPECGGLEEDDKTAC